MDIWQAMTSRHSVRAYLDKPIEADKAAALREEIARCNAASGLSIQLVLEEPEAFAAGKAHYGAFSGCRNYIAMVGPQGADEAVGYYGERLVLLATGLGLSTCWVALTYRKGKARITVPEGQSVYVVVALGYGKTQGVPHKNKAINKVSDLTEDAPHWYAEGIRAALLAPTAINQQKFYISRQGNKVLATAKWGPCAKIDLGIVKYHFEQGAGKENFEWVTL